MTCSSPSLNLVFGDLHISSKNAVSKFEQKYLPLIANEIQKLNEKDCIDKVILLGDFSEYWKESNNILPVYKVLFKLVKLLTNSLPNLKKIVLIEGNHDVYGTKSLLKGGLGELLSLAYPVQIKAIPAITGDMDEANVDVSEFVDSDDNEIYLPYVSKPKVLEHILNSLDSNRFSKANVYSHNNFYEMYPDLPEIYRKEFLKFRDYFANDTVLVSGHVHLPNFDKEQNIYVLGSIHFQTFNEANTLPILFGLYDRANQRFVKLVKNILSDIFVNIESNDDIESVLIPLLEAGIETLHIRVKDVDSLKDRVENVLKDYKVFVKKFTVKDSLGKVKFIPMDISEMIINNNVQIHLESMIKELATDSQAADKEDVDNDYLFELINKLEESIVVGDIVDITQRILNELFKKERE